VPKASPEQPKTDAQEVGLDGSAFEQCLSSGPYQAPVQRDVEEGTRVGALDTRTFFINGGLLTGAQLAPGKWSRVCSGIPLSPLYPLVHGPQARG
jgi:protein-disulfide isomerase